MSTARTRRAGPLFGVLLVVVGLLAALAPTVPGVRALDPTPTPSSEVPTATLDPTPTPDPATPPPDPATPPPSEPAPEPSLAPSDPAPTEAAPSEPVPTVTPDPSVSPEPDPSTTPSIAPSPDPTVAPGGLQVTHAWVDTLSLSGAVTTRGALDQPIVDAERFTVYRVRFQVVNDSETERSMTPALQVRAGGAWMLLPEVDPRPEAPFYAASDQGKVFRQRDAAIGADALRLTTSSDPLAGPVEGRSSAGRNPARAVLLPAHSFTEVEFAVRATVDADWSISYAFRLADGAELLGATPGATISMGPKPAIRLTPGQKAGKDVAAALPRYALDLSGIDQPANSQPTTASVVGLRTPLAAGGSFVTPHTNYTLTTDACAACHATHRAQADNLVGSPAPLGNICFSCHDGSGATSDVEAEFTAPSVPANDEATSSWYSHPSLASSALTHTSDKVDEFGGTLNRHAECADCHQPHLADGTRPVGTTAGWTAAGSIKGASGVSVVNGAAGTSPTYTLETTTEFEYQLCFKCHSGYTDLPAPDPAHPSRWALDKAVELNPANVSYHPVEAPGRNQTSAMDLSLAGTSPYKLWAFDSDSTIRCLNCHGDSALANPLSPPAAGAALDNHAGPNRGLLIAPYRDRDLLATSELYDATDAALCLSCHAEEPMVDDSGDVRYDSNFNWHGFHLNAMTFNGTGGRDIDVAGDGQGNATCAECHFRTHSTAFPVNGQAPAKGLVNFAPNIQPLNGQLEFVSATSTALGTCTLVCHGKPHDGYVYAAAP